MELYVIRHAQSANNALYTRNNTTIGRSDDPELTDIGREQTRRLAEFIATPRHTTNDNFAARLTNAHGFHFTHLYCSLMVRSIETGLAIANATGLPLVAWPDWHETGGIFYEDPNNPNHRTGQPGKTAAELTNRFPDLTITNELDPAGWWNRPFEDHPAQIARAERVLADLIARHGYTDHRVAVITHGGFYNRFLQAVLKFNPDQRTWFTLVNCGITRIDFDEDDTMLFYQNRHEHLSPELLTW